MNVLNMGETVLRKQVMAMHMATLVAFATGKSTVSRVVTTPNEDKGVQLAPRLAPLGGKG